MNQSTFQLLGNVASADFYLCEGSDITLNNFYVGMIPIDHNQILTMISHINTTIIPFNYQEITNFIGSIIFGVGKYFHSKSTRP